MSITWNDSVPIYRQLRERVVAMILGRRLERGRPAAVSTPGGGGLSNQSAHCI